MAKQKTTKNTREKKKVISSKPFYGKRTTSSGNRACIGTRFYIEDGSQIVLLNPYGKSSKYAYELHNGYKYTNSGKRKLDDNGAVMLLTDTEAAWRSGYLAARQDSAKAYKANRGKKS